MDEQSRRVAKSRPILIAIGFALCTAMLTACGGSDDNDVEIGQYDCSVFPSAQSSDYILPWLIGQSYEAVPHTGRDGPTNYAIDFLMPIGTDLVAVRDGVVTSVEERFVDGDHDPAHSNFVLVQHDDGTIALYFHLTNMGALVQAGDEVRQGDIIARSGHTGPSFQPHLHLEVLRAGCADIRQCSNIPLNFRNAQADSGPTDLSCGLRHFVFYSAMPF